MMATKATPAARPPRRPGRMAAGRVILVVVLSLLVGLLLNAQDILRTAERQEAGWQRRVGVAVMTPVAAIADRLALDAPRNLLDTAMGRSPSPATTTTTLPTAATSPPSSTTTVPEIREVSADDPLHVFIGGDSMVGQFGPMLEARAEGSGPVSADVVYEFDSGITRPDFVDWPARLREVRAEQDPDVIVLFFGGNDAQDIQIDGRWVAFGTDEWIAEYRSRVGSLMEELADDGREVYWVGMPIVSSDDFRSRVEILNRVYEEEAATFDRVHYVDSWSVFTGPDGGYSEYLPDENGNLVDMRLNDGIHLTTDGAILLAGVVWEQIASSWGLE